MRAEGDVKLDTVSDAVAAVAAGETVIVVADGERENEGDLVMSAETATPERMAFMIRHTSGIVCVALTEERAERLNLPLMAPKSLTRIWPPSRSAWITGSA